MSEMVRVNDYVFQGAKVTFLPEVKSKPTGKLLKSVEVEALLPGRDWDWYNESLKNKFIDFEIIGTDVIFRGEISQKMSSYTGKLNNDTVVNLEFKVVERDPSLPEDHDVSVAGHVFNMENRLMLKTLFRLLIESGMITREQLNQKYQEVVKEEMETKELNNEYFFGIQPPKREDK